jgi:hypothetical protein
VTFGEGPLSSPLLVEAAETLFVPVAIRNNVEGYEKEVLDRYAEPTWNNPVVRYLDAKGKDLIPRKDRVWDLGGTVARMAASLEAARRPVPAWFATLEEETASGEVETAAFAMF